MKKRPWLILAVFMALMVAACAKQPTDPPQKDPSPAPSQSVSPYSVPPGDETENTASASPSIEPSSITEETDGPSDEPAASATPEPKVFGKTPVFPAPSAPSPAPSSSAPEPARSPVPAPAPTPTPKPTPAPIPVEAVTLDLVDETMARGDRLTLRPTVTPANATDQAAQYTSSDARIVSVSGDGTMRAVAAGTATIRCTVGGISASCTVTVTVPVTSISVSAKRSVYAVGDSCSFSVKVYPEDATDPSYTLSLSGAEATLSGADTLTCDTGGSITITAAAGGVRGSLTVTSVDLTAYADEVLRLVNIERQNAGLSALAQNTSLTKVAVVRAKELIKLFSHTRPDGQDTWSAYDEQNVKYQSAGENIAAGQKTPESVVRDWMNSPGHKANILSGNYGHLGVGVAMDDNGKLYWAQNFMD